MTPVAVICPQCGSERVWKDGIRYSKEGMVQRYLCRICGHRFSDSQVKVDIVKQGSVLSNPMHDLGDLDSVNIGFGEVSFEDSTLPVRKDVGSHGFSVVGKSINEFLHNRRGPQVCAPKPESKNLAEVEPLKEKAAGATATQQDVQGKIIEFLWNLKRQGRSELTIKQYVRQLKHCAEFVNILDPKEVKRFIAEKNTMKTTKCNTVHAFKTFYKFLKLP